jgi:hypothetical protein
MERRVKPSHRLTRGRWTKDFDGYEENRLLTHLSPIGFRVGFRHDHPAFAAPFLIPPSFLAGERSNDFWPISFERLEGEGRGFFVIEDVHQGWERRLCGADLSEPHCSGYENGTFA